MGIESVKSSMELNGLWDEFLEDWPIDRLRSMSLAEYTQSGNPRTFTNWLESGLEDLGSIWGGSAFKFGIYHRNDTAAKPSDAMRSYTDQYGWYTKYGQTPEVAFGAVKREVITVAEAAKAGQFAAIDQVDLGKAVKWKIAFLYQDRKNPTVIPVYNGAHLRAFLNELSKSKPRSVLYAELKAIRGDADVFEFGRKVWTESEEILNGERLTVEAAEAYLVERYGKATSDQKKLAGFESGTGRQLAIEREISSVRLYLEPGPWDKITGVVNVKSYGPQDARHSNLAQQAPNISLGYPAVLVSISSMTGLEALCAAYDKSANTLDIHNEEPSMFAGQPLNQILYGPPGTGKTYTAVAKAVQIADPIFFASNAHDRNAIHIRYNELSETGRIAFVTFHQSFSYEDFVEGIRPELNERQQLIYPVIDGVFKKICDAASARVTKRASGAIELEGRRIWKMSLGNTVTDGDNVFQECLDDSCILLGYGDDINFTGCKTPQDIQKLLLERGIDVNGADSYAATAVSTFILKMQKGDLVIVSDGNHKFRGIAEIIGDYRFVIDDNRDGYWQCRNVRWLRAYNPSLPRDQLMNNAFSQMTLYRLRPGSIDLKKLAILLNTSASEKTMTDSLQPWVLIIDEINRGNVSRIFGELITLLEPDKRSGASEALAVKLPYSKAEFSIPQNLYIIGTMNTADRSLTGLDVALRRRFEFEEVAPDSSLLAGVEVEGLSVANLLEIMNHRIEILLNRDHCLGHSYFMVLKKRPTLDVLEDIFRRHILPLLQEYFFEDWERIRWVLNDHRKSDRSCQFLVAPEYDLGTLLGEGGEIPKDNRQWALNPEGLRNIDSYQQIIEA